MVQATHEAVRREITVDASPEKAFRVFTERFDTWWPRSHSIAQPEMQEAVLEQRQGGRWYERGVDGSTCDWGEVLTWDPPHRLVLSWHIGGDWTYDPERFSEIDVSFTPAGEGTRVQLEHRHFERHGATADALREAVGGDGGWNGLLKRYEEALGSS
jgi:uncharacterized protein YndB with AHSA1/START domain